MANYNQSAMLNLNKPFIFNNINERKGKVNSENFQTNL